jgi:hypothetical protein
LPFEFNLQHYSVEFAEMLKDSTDTLGITPGIRLRDVAGLCTLHSFDPYPITFSLSNP